MSEEVLPPHLKVSDTVTEEEYATAKIQSEITLLAVIGSSCVVLVLVILFVTGLNISGVLIGLVAGVCAGLLCDKVMNQVMPEGKKMKTGRMKVYPQLREYRKRQG